MHDDEKKQKLVLAEKLISEQNFAAAAIAGAVAMILAAIVYGIVIKNWPFSYGFAAAGIGIVIGFFMGFLGRGISLKFSVLAAVYTILGCVLGNIFGVVSPLDVFESSDFLRIAGRSISDTSFVDLVFWLVAVFAAVFLAKRPLSRSDKLALGLYELRG